MQSKFCPQCGLPLTEAEIAGRVRKKCSAPGRGFVSCDTPTPVVAAIVEHQGRVILTRNKGWFGIVTGFF